MKITVVDLWLQASSYWPYAVVEMIPSSKLMGVKLQNPFTYPTYEVLTQRPPRPRSERSV